MKISNICSWTIGVLWLGLASNPAMGFTLDLFNETESNFLQIPGTSIPYPGQQAEVNGLGLIPPSDTDTNLDNTNVVGENRHIKIETTSGLNRASLLIGTTSDNILNLETGSSTTSIGTIVWNGSSNIDFNDLEANAALGDATSGLDLEIDGDDSIGINVKASDHQGAIKLTLYDGEDTYTFPQTLPIVGENDPPQTVYYDYATYTANDVNVNNVRYISLEVAGVSASDIELDFLETTREVPFEFSPSLGIIIGSTFLSFKIYKLNKRKTARY